MWPVGSYAGVINVCRGRAWRGDRILVRLVVDCKISQRSQPKRQRVPLSLSLSLCVCVSRRLYIRRCSFYRNYTRLVFPHRNVTPSHCTLHSLEQNCKCTLLLFKRPKIDSQGISAITHRKYFYRYFNVTGLNFLFQNNFFEYKKKKEIIQLRENALGNAIFYLMRFLRVVNNKYTVII